MDFGMKFDIIFLHLTALFLLTGCKELFSLTPTPLSAINVYDAYSIAKDERKISQIGEDKFIKTKIQAKIFASKRLSNINLDVQSFYANVYLIGVVKDQEAKDELINLAKNTLGVEKIYTYIRFENELKKCENSMQIMLTLQNNLFRDSKIKGTNVRVSLVGCDVVFTGLITDIEQEKHAIWYASHIRGVNDVYSFLRVVE